MGIGVVLSNGRWRPKRFRPFLFLDFGVRPESDRNQTMPIGMIVGQ